MGTSLVAADFDGDGFPDVAISEVDSEIGPGEPSGFGLMTWRNLGDGTFAPPSFLLTHPETPSPAITYTTLLKAADLDGDGHLDLLGNDQSLAFFRGPGDGSFAPPAVSKGPATSRFAVGDFDEDGVLDVVADAVFNAVLDLADDKGHFWHGNGKGGFTAGDPFALGTRLSSLTAADVDGDGHLDLLATHCCGQNPGEVQLLLGNGKGNFAVPKVILTYPGALNTAVGDLDGNGYPDVVVIGGDSKTMRITVLLGNGKSDFSVPMFYGSEHYPNTLQLADFNNDNHLDLLVGTNHGPEILLNRANGMFDKPLNPSNLADVGNLLVAVADANHDGRLDFVVGQGASFTCYLNTSP
jgi:hypothetical protein